MPLLRQPVNFQSPYDATSLPAHYAGSSLTVCACAYIVSPIDGSIVAITSASIDLVNIPGYPGVTFKSAAGMTASQMQGQAGQTATNLETDLFLITAGITPADALAGKWSRALATVFVMNYEVPKMGQFVMLKGYLGQFVQKGPMLTTEIQGFNSALQMQYGRVTRAECSRDYGDALCTRDVVALGEVKTGAITAVTSQTVFRVASLIGTGTDYFGNGKVKFTSGNNNGYTFPVDAWDDTTGQFTLRTPTPYLPINGDTISATRGCRKRPVDCAAHGSNTINADFFPWIPTMEEITRLPLF